MSSKGRCDVSTELGVYTCLTDSYCLVGITYQEPKKRIKIMHEVFRKNMPVIHITIGGCGIIGALVVGNNHGLLVSSLTTDQEFDYIRDQLPTGIKLERLENEPYNALGNVISCNDHRALIHPDLTEDTERTIRNVLQVKVFRHIIGFNPLVGTYFVFNNRNGMIQPKTTMQARNELSEVLQIHVGAGTVNHGCNGIGAGLIVNEQISYTGWDSSNSEWNFVHNTFESFPFRKNN